MIETKLVATIRDTVEAGHFGERMMLTVDSRGRLYGTDLSVNRWNIRVFDARGQLMRVIGRNGSGPGEFRWAYPPLFGPADTMIVLDPQLYRVSKFSPNYEFISSHQLSAGTFRRAIVTPAGQLVLTGVIRSESQVGLPLHLVGQNGTLIHSFGSPAPILDPTLPYETMRQIGTARDGVWSAFLNRYLIERWSLDGMLKETVQRNASWFPVWQHYEGPLTVVQPVPTVEAVWEDEPGRLWVAILVADANWRRTNLKAHEGDMIPERRADNNSVYDTIIEVLDVSNGRLLATARFPQAFQSVSNGPPFTTYTEDASGNPTYRVWRFELQQRR